MNSSDSTVTLPVAPTQAEQIKAKILDLQEALQKQLPSYESLLHTIHRNLSMDASTVHLLSEEEIGVICAGLQKRTGVFIQQEVVKKVKVSKGKISVDDL